MKINDSNISTGKKRIEYIDALRGFLMLLVVFCHVECFGFFDFSYNTPFGQFISTFRMPLFFFISGFVAYKSEEWDFRWWINSTKKKARVLLIPTFVFGLIYTYLHLHKNASSFIGDPAKLGYWFTIALFEMFTIYYTINLLYHQFIKHKVSVSRRESAWYILLIISAILLFILKFPLKYFPVLRSIGDILSLHYTFKYFQFFVFGIIASKYRTHFLQVIDGKILMAIFIVLFFTLTFLQYNLLSTHLSEKLDMWIILNTLIYTISGYFGILVIYGYFKKNQDSFSSDTQIGKALQFIGRRTLDIYMLHYFFLPSLPQIGTFLKSSPNIIIEISLCSLVSIIIILCCIALSSVLRTSDFIEYYLFGKKRINP